MDIFEIITCIRKRLYIIILVTVISVGVVAWYSFFILSPVYEAKSSILVNSITEKLESNKPKDDFNAIMQAVPQFPTLTMNSYIAQARSEILMERIIKKMGLKGKGYTVASLNSQIVVNFAGESNLLEVKVRNNNPELAAEISNVFCNEYINLVNEKRLEYINMSILSTEKEAERLNNNLTTLTNETDKKVVNKIISYLDYKVVNTKIARAIYTGNNDLIVYSSASVPKQPIGPNTLYNMVITFILASTNSIFLVVILDMVSNYKKKKQKDSEEMREPKSYSGEVIESVFLERSELGIKEVVEGRNNIVALAQGMFNEPLEQISEIEVNGVSNQVPQGEGHRTIETTAVSPKDLLVEGIRLAKHSKYPRAVRCLNKVIDSKPDAELLYLAITELSSIYQHLGLYPMASAIIKTFDNYPALQSHPGSANLKQKQRFIVALEDLLESYKYGQIPYEQVPEAVRREAFDQTLKITV